MRSHQKKKKSEKLQRAEVMRCRRRKRKSEVELGKGVREHWPVQAKFVNYSVDLGLPFFRVASLNCIELLCEEFPLLWKGTSSA